MVEPRQWLQIETLTPLLTNAPTTNHTPLAQPPVAFGHGHEFSAPEDVFSTHQWYFLLPIADDIL